MIIRNQVVVVVIPSREDREQWADGNRWTKSHKKHLPAPSVVKGENVQQVDNDGPPAQCRACVYVGLQHCYQYLHSSIGLE